MGSFLAVAQGSDEPLRFIVARYDGAPRTSAPVVLVGKGITFDTGGISIKPSERMWEMKNDMAGSATVMGAIAAIASLENQPTEKGSATITLTVTLNFESGRLDIKPSVKSKLPEEKSFAGTPFWSHDGGLSTQHPSQADMFGPRDAEERQRETA
jgi:hypothetical protein